MQQCFFAGCTGSSRRRLLDGRSWRPAAAEASPNAAGIPWMPAPPSLQLASLLSLRTTRPACSTHTRLPPPCLFSPRLNGTSTLLPMTLCSHPGGGGCPDRVPNHRLGRRPHKVLEEAASRSRVRKALQGEAAGWAAFRPGCRPGCLKAPRGSRPGRLKTLRGCGLGSLEGQGPAGAASWPAGVMLGAVPHCRPSRPAMCLA